MTTLVVGYDSDIGKCIYDALPGGIATSRHENSHILLELEDRANWPTFDVDTIDKVYYCIGVGGRNNSPEKIMNINAILSFEFLDYLAPFLAKGATVYILTSVVSSMAYNVLNYVNSNIYYKMSKAALNMGVINLHNKHKDINWTLVHPGFVKTKMTMGLDTTSAITPELAAKKIISIPAYKGITFINANNRTDISW